ncbi:hypothetical protein BED47_20715 [Gottfriedia luciferensis]|uniref:Uncharacterized protein n=1 Tax=Gottfriedia luciferensis TaxID=178774 RepID=A0ABX2ZS38_9BACI|nr:hypothetical protein [Gottfriedia luciferensis]ODG92212.1 hypothetical protein BED47_20715 [Gottfriedia luciferensis]
MSTYKEFLIERNQIDSLIKKGYQIKSVRETLDGAYVDFENQEEEDRFITLHIMNADTRKYFGSLIIKQFGVHL